MTKTQGLSNLSIEKRALLEQRLNKHRAARAIKVEIPTLSRSADEQIELSFPQQRLWFLEQLERDRTRYNLSAAMTIRGALNIGALQRSLDEIVRRHESLRTNIVASEGRPFQRIQPPRPVLLAHADLRGLPERMNDVIRERCAARFNLASDLMLRAVLLHLAQNEYVLLITMHHIASDAWSMSIFFDELAECYRAFSAGCSPELPALRVQYADFARWQRKTPLDAPLNYWRGQLQFPPEPLQLPSSCELRDERTGSGERVRFTFSKELSQAVKALAKSENASDYMVLLAALKVLLHRYSGQTDIIVGSPIANRNRVELEKLIGFFVNTLALRTRLDGDPSFREVLARVRESALAAYAHQDVPFEKLVEELQPERRAGQPPYFQVMFVLQNVRELKRELAGVEIEPLPVHDGSARFDLTVCMHETREGFKGWIEHDAGIMSGAAAQRIGAHLETLLTGATRVPDALISKLPLLTPAEESQVLNGLNGTACDFPREPLHVLFEEQAARAPNASAVSYGHDRATYSELNRRANQIANRLRALGAPHGAFIAICADRSVDLIAGILGILKSGGAYVPLDPGYPRERLAFMLDDTRAPIVVTQRKHLDAFCNSNATLLLLDDSLAGEGTENLPSNSTSEHPAYVIYTSGSTGVPKGICIPQRAVARLVFNTNYIRITPADRIAQVSNASFDAATFEIWGALLHGAQLAGITRDVALSPRDFAAEIQNQSITGMFLTTALFNLLVREAPGAFKDVETLLFGGEACDPRTIALALQNDPPRRLLHVYGPTEVTTFSTWHEVALVAPGAKTVPIGRPISNTTAYILDRELNPVPPAVVGEIYLGGDGLALGYHNRPGLNAEKFIPHPFQPCARLYRTGDLGRVNEKGEIEFCGRADHQVKIRGFRIELGEIEAVISKFPGVREAVVVVRDTSQGDRAIVAYISCDESNSTTLRKYLAGKLPEYMVPSAFVFLERLPLTPNGKVDRKALPGPSQVHVARTKSCMPPASPVHSQMIQIWEELLDVRPIGIRDNFFEIGGHSLLAVRLMARIETVFKRSVPLSALFAGATIEHLSNVLLEQSPGANAIVHLNKSGTRPPLFFMHGDLLGAGLYCANLAALLGGDQPLVLLPPHVPENEKLPTVVEMARVHVDSIRKFSPHGPYSIAGFCLGGCVAFEAARQLAGAGERVDTLCIIDFALPENWLRIARGVTAAAGKLSRRTEIENIESFERACDRCIRFKSRTIVGNLSALGEKLVRKIVRAKKPTPEQLCPPALFLRSGLAPKELIHAYHWQLAGYTPRRCGVPATLLLSEAFAADAGRIAARWKRFIPDLKVDAIRGGHLECVTVHAGILAQKLNSLLR